MTQKLETPIYLEVINLGNDAKVCRLSNGCDNVPLEVRRAFADLLLDKHTSVNRGSLGGAGKMYGTSHFPGTHRYDNITPAGLMSDTDFWFYELHGSLKNDLSAGSTIAFIVRDGDDEVDLDSDMVLKAHASGSGPNPIRVVSFRYHDSTLVPIEAH